MDELLEERLDDIALPSREAPANDVLRKVKNMSLYEIAEKLGGFDKPMHFSLDCED